ncbi:MAG: hypothetical protein FJY92_12815, partial [Candidatus Hydrogenedentes bacterium]|nr:hypothetical protein [Candidatus Hydrogenedentota bacterium]
MRAPSLGAKPWGFYRRPIREPEPVLVLVLVIVIVIDLSITCQTNQAMRLRRVFTCAGLKDDRIFEHE